MYKKKMSLGSLPLQSFTLIKTVRIVISTVLCVCVCARVWMRILLGGVVAAVREGDHKIKLKKIERNEGNR